MINFTCEFCVGQREDQPLGMESKATLFKYSKVSVWEKRNYIGKIGDIFSIKLIVEYGGEKYNLIHQNRAS